jgi:hypothetical protein
MAYVSQEMKSKLSPTVKALLKKYGLKGSLSVRHHSTLVLTVNSGRIDFIKNYNETVAPHPRYNEREFTPAKDSIQVNTYWCHEHFSGDAKDFLVAAVAALKGPDFFDHSDAQTDYFHCSHYVDINIGRWDKPYTVAV